MSGDQDSLHWLRVVRTDSSAAGHENRLKTVFFYELDSERLRYITTSECWRYECRYASQKTFELPPGLHLASSEINSLRRGEHLIKIALVTVNLLAMLLLCGRVDTVRWMSPIKFE